MINIFVEPSPKEAAKIPNLGKVSFPIDGSLSFFYIKNNKEKKNKKKKKKKKKKPFNKLIPTLVSNKVSFS